MRVGFSTNSMSCQPLRNFGKADNLPKNNTPAANNNPAFTSGTVSRAEYDKLNAKYDLLSRFAVLQVQQYNELAAKYKAIAQKQFIFLIQAYIF